MLIIWFTYYLSGREIEASDLNVYVISSLPYLLYYIQYANNDNSATNLTDFSYRLPDFFMRINRPKHYQLSSQVEWMTKVNQKKDAMCLIQDYFTKPEATTWDEFYNKLVMCAISLSIEMLVRIPNVIASMVALADTAGYDPLKILIPHILQEARVRMSEAQKLEAEVSMAVKDLYPKIRKEKMEEIFVKSSVTYLVNMYIDILKPLRNIEKRQKLYISVIERGYELAMDIDCQELFDALSSELNHHLGNLKLPIDTKLSVLRLLFIRYRAAIELGMYTRAFKTLSEASIFLQSHTSPLELHEELEVAKSVLLQIRQDRIPAAVQMNKLVGFYESSPIDPSIPIQSMKDLTVMTALVAPLESKFYGGFVNFVGVEIPERDKFVAMLLKDLRFSSLKEFALAAEEHTDPILICTAFQCFLREFGRVLKVPILYKALGKYAAIRIIQAAVSESDQVEISKLVQMIRWMSEYEIHTLICEVIRIGHLKARIDMMTGVLKRSQ